MEDAGQMFSGSGHVCFKDDNANLSRRAAATVPLERITFCSLLVATT